MQKINFKRLVFFLYIWDFPNLRTFYPYFSVNAWKVCVLVVGFNSQSLASVDSFIISGRKGLDGQFKICWVVSFSKLQKMHIPSRSSAVSPLYGSRWPLQKQNVIVHERGACRKAQWGVGFSFLQWRERERDQLVCFVTRGHRHSQRGVAAGKVSSPRGSASNENPSLTSITK